MVERPRCQRPQPPAAVSLHGALHLQDLQQTLQLARPHIDLVKQFPLHHGRSPALQHAHDPLGSISRREGRADEVVLDVGVLGASQQDSQRFPQGAPGPPDLLVVGHRRSRRLVVDHEREIGLVESHAQRGCGHHDFHVVGQESLFDGAPVLVVALAAVRLGGYAVGLEPARDPVGVGDGQAVDDAGAGQFRDHGGEPHQPLGLRRFVERVEP